MNRDDMLAVKAQLAEYHAILKERHGVQDMPKKDRARLERQMDVVAKLYQKLKVPEWRQSKKPKEVKAGVCPCGGDVMMGERYSTKTDGPTTISRACSRCFRYHDVVLTTKATFKVVDWTVRDCLCGYPIRIRSDYAGLGFDEYRGDPFATGTMKNRTVKAGCPACKCRWEFTIRFERVQEEGRHAGRWRRTIPKQLVTRCAPCRELDTPGLTPVEPKKKRAAS